MHTARARTTGFTLVELLVVVAVISLLVGILVPVVHTVIVGAETIRSMARVVELGDGCYLFKDETGFYPGQENFAALKGTPGGSGRKYTGSQVLAAGLFGCTLAQLVNPSQPPPMSANYAPIKVNDLDKFHSGGSWAAKYSGELGTILDRFSDGPLAVLYYPCRLNLASTDAAALYLYDDNGVYVYPLFDDYRVTNETPELTRPDYTTAMRGRLHGAGYGGTAAGGARNQGGFIIVAAGKDRLYMTGDDLIFP